MSAELARHDADARRTRIAAILNHEEARGREGLAHHLAFETALSPAKAAAALAAAPRSEFEEGAAAASALLGLRGDRPTRAGRPA